MRYAFIMIAISLFCSSGNPKTALALQSTNFQLNTQPTNYSELPSTQSTNFQVNGGTTWVQQPGQSTNFLTTIAPTTTTVTASSSSSSTSSSTSSVSSTTGFTGGGDSGGSGGGGGGGRRTEDAVAIGEESSETTHAAAPSSSSSSSSSESYVFDPDLNPFDVYFDPISSASSASSVVPSTPSSSSAASSASSVVPIVVAVEQPSSSSESSLEFGQAIPAPTIEPGPVFAPTDVATENLNDPVLHNWYDRELPLAIAFPFVPAAELPGIGLRLKDFIDKSGDLISMPLAMNSFMRAIAASNSWYNGSKYDGIRLATVPRLPTVSPCLHGAAPTQEPTIAKALQAMFPWVPIVLLVWCVRLDSDLHQKRLAFTKPKTKTT